MSSKREVLEQEFQGFRYSYGESIEALTGRFAELLSEMEKAEIEVSNRTSNTKLLDVLKRIPDQANCSWFRNVNQIIVTTDCYCYKMKPNELISLIKSYNNADKQSTQDEVIVEDWVKEDDIVCHKADDVCSKTSNLSADAPPYRHMKQGSKVEQFTNKSSNKLYNSYSASVGSNGSGYAPYVKKQTCYNYGIHGHIARNYTHRPYMPYYTQHQRVTPRDRSYSKPMKVDKPKAMMNKHPWVKPSDGD
ncbi:hypothetical protein HanRHA438_Chr02g0054181 [Helianthus annuus]|uniref:Uncharacterized protein n=1 Tax=Helianthus annuus TaxID=4232 RepID=A0A9K3NYQ5_HELAN|nr:hypothetical protein HanXRQr2_Chr02g0052901 [Helianthus annuus]KAJ0938832.1 hypothetical protein HanRHA438_Chr02g0054181 [Helianthus annuus]